MEVDQLIYSESDFIENSIGWNAITYQLSKFDTLLRHAWDKAMDEGHFRYQLDIEDTKIIGTKNYVAQLNIKRATARRQPDAIETLSQCFNPLSFNFTRIKKGEILFEMVKNNKTVTNAECRLLCKHCAANSTDCCSKQKLIENGAQENGTDEKGSYSDTTKRVRNLVVINVSPLEYGHVLLVPDVDACRPQILTEEALILSLEMMLLSKHRGFRVGFNSLCAFASVNHQHLHAYYLEHELFVESTTVEHVCGELYELVSMPAKGFAFQLHGSTVQALSRLIFQIADYFQTSEIAHNLYMTRGPTFNESRCSCNRTVRVYLWPRKKFIGIKDEAAFNVALVELAGHLPVKIRELFGELDETKIEATIKEVVLEDDDYNRVKRHVMSICQNTADSSTITTQTF